MKRHFKILFLFLFLSATIPLSTQAQSSTKTPYEQKVSLILKKFLIEIGLNIPTAEKASTDPSYLQSIQPTIEDKLNRYRMSHGDLSALSLFTDYQKNMDNAKSLMNPQEKERDRIESAKTEKQEQDKKLKEEYMLSDAYNLKEIIHKKYTEWSKKGEYEKTNDYESRIADKPKAVRNIIIECVQNYTQFMNTIGTSNGDKFQLSCYIGDYNVDDESLGLIFKNSKGLELKGQIKLSPEKAQKLKSSARTTNSNGTTLYYTDALIAVQDKCNLGFYNNNIMTAKIGVKLRTNDGNGNKHFEYPEVKITTPLKVDLGEHFFTTSNLQIDMQGNENFTFKDINDACVKITSN